MSLEADSLHHRIIQHSEQSFTMAILMPPKKPRKTRHLKVFGYLLNPYSIYQQAVSDGTAIKDQRFSTVMLYMHRLADHCGVESNDVMRVYPNRNGAAPVYCIVAASNLSDETKLPRTDIVEKAKDFLGTNEEPKWYYVSYE
jgi:hypothetical protein